MSTLILDQAITREERSQEMFVWKEVRPIEVIPLRGEEYPLLVDIWDNEDDAIYDTL